MQNLLLCCLLGAKVEMSMRYREGKWRELHVPSLHAQLRTQKLFEVRRRHPDAANL